MGPKVLAKRKAVPPLKARRADGIPLYIQIARILREEIENGTYPFGSEFPIEEDLCTRFAVSRYTVREAMRRLREEGLLSSRQGVRSTVVPSPAAHSYVLNPMSISELVTYTVNTDYVIDSIKMVSADDKLASKMGVSIGDEWLRLRGFRHAEGADDPVCWTEVYVNKDFAAVGRLLQRHKGPIFPLIEDMFAAKVMEVEQKISGTLISPGLADGLKVKAGSPALEIRRWYKLADGKVAQFTLSTHPSSRFCYSMTMRRIEP